MTQLSPYPQWQWEIPEFFNIGVACSDRHLGTPKADEIAMIVEDDSFGTSTITFSELAARTDCFAQVLRELGVLPGDRVLIRLPNSLDYPTAFLGTMKIGAISVPTSTLLTAEEVAYLSKDSGAVVLVTDAAAWAGMSAKMQQNISQTPNLRHIVLTQLQGAVEDSTVQCVVTGSCISYCATACASLCYAW